MYFLVEKEEIRSIRDGIKRLFQKLCKVVFILLM